MSEKAKTQFDVSYMCPRHGYKVGDPTAHGVLCNGKGENCPKVPEQYTGSRKPGGS